MTHALEDWLYDTLLAYGYQATPEEAHRIALGFLRHPAMREPSEGMTSDMWSCGSESMIDAWVAGLDALAREVEESR